MDLGIKYQPTSMYFPKKNYGQTKVVSRSFQSKWYKDWPWLHYIAATDSVLCYTCATAVKQKKLPTSATCRMDEAFVSRGYGNWKSPTVAFKKHESTICHRTTTEVMISLSTQVCDIGEQLSTRYREERAENREIFLKILGNIRFIARQGLAFGGSGDDDDRIVLWMKKKYE